MRSQLPTEAKHQPEEWLAFQNGPYHLPRPPTATFCTNHASELLADICAIQISLIFVLLQVTGRVYGQIQTQPDGSHSVLMPGQTCSFPVRTASQDNSLFFIEIANTYYLVETKEAEVSETPAKKIDVATTATPTQAGTEAASSPAAPGDQHAPLRKLVLRGNALSRSQWGMVWRIVVWMTALVVLASIVSYTRLNRHLTEQDVALKNMHSDYEAVLQALREKQHDNEGLSYSLENMLSKLVAHLSVMHQLTESRQRADSCERTGDNQLQEINRLLDEVSRAHNRIQSVLAERDQIFTQKDKQIREVTNELLNARHRIAKIEKLQQLQKHGNSLKTLGISELIRRILEL